jgi:hypothetical protein
MENHPNSLEALFEKTGDYVETRIELLKLQAVNTASDVTSSMAARFTIALIAGLIIFILNIGIAMWIGDALGKMYYGFFLVSGFYILLVVLLYAFRAKWIKKPLHDMLIKKMLN